MRLGKKIFLTLFSAGICFLAAGSSLGVQGMKLPLRYDAEIENDDIVRSGEQSVEVADWNRRIYRVTYTVNAAGIEEGTVRAYAGKNFHLTDSQGNILSEGMRIDGAGNAADDGDGLVCRDISGWYILWGKPDLPNWGVHYVYVQADSDFVGGNNQTIGIEGKTGIYAGDNMGEADWPLNISSVNVAVEIEALDTNLPVMQAMDLTDGRLIKNAVVKLNCIYGELADVPLKAQWYREADGTESPAGEVLTHVPYSLPQSEVITLTEAKEYVLKLYYDGEVSTEESRANSGGRETEVTTDKPVAEARLTNELLTGTILLSVQLEQRPYNDGSDFHVFGFRLYRFDSPNQVITEDTPYAEYFLAFEPGGEDTKKELQINGLTDGWYTLVPQMPDSHYVEKGEDRSDNCWPNGRTGNSAGIDFHIGEITDNQYSWEILRYQGQDMADPLGDNFFRANYIYKETIYTVNYKPNLPEGAELKGQGPSDASKYPAGEMVTVKGSNGMNASGWQFAGWSTEEGDGVYKSGETLYSDTPVHNIGVQHQVAMAEGGITLYGRWLPVYSVSYSGNTNSGGNPPSDNLGTVSPNTNIYYSGDEVTVRAPGNLEKKDPDGTQYVFDGWCLSQDGTGARLKDGDKVGITDSDLTFYAQWKTVSADKYAVSYIAVLPKDTVMKGVLPSDTDKYEEGQAVAVKNQGSIALEHYKFAGWSLTSREDGIYQSGEELYGTKDIGKTVTKTEAPMKAHGLYFYSRWIPLYQVIYNANASDAEGIPEDGAEYEVNEIAKIQSGAKMKRDGYEFMGWNTKRDGSGQSYDGGLTFNMPAENLVLYAQWEKLPQPESQPEIKNPVNPGHRGTWPLVILAIIGAVCIAAYIVYQWMSHRKG